LSVSEPTLCMLIAEITFCWWGMHICRHVNVVYVLLSHTHKSNDPHIYKIKSELSYCNVPGVLFTMEVYFCFKILHTTVKYSQQLSRYVRTIHHWAVSPLAHQNSTSAYSPSLTCHLLALTINCLYNSRDPQETPSTGPFSCCLSPNTSSLHELRRSNDFTVGCLLSTVHCRLTHWLMSAVLTGLIYVGSMVDYVTVLYCCIVM
jgi:hypothetical protein